MTDGVVVKMDYEVVKTWRVRGTSVEDAIDKADSDKPYDEVDVREAFQDRRGEEYEYVVSRTWRVSAGSSAEAIKRAEPYCHDRIDVSGGPEGDDLE